MRPNLVALTIGAPATAAFDRSVSSASPLKKEARHDAGLPIGPKRAGYFCWAGFSASGLPSPLVLLLARLDLGRRGGLRSFLGGCVRALLLIGHSISLRKNLKIIFQELQRSGVYSLDYNREHTEYLADTPVLLDPSSTVQVINRLIGHGYPRRGNALALHFVGLIRPRRRGGLSAAARRRQRRARGWRRGAAAIAARSTCRSARPWSR